MAEHERGRRASVVRGPAAPSTTTLLAVVGIGLGASLVFASLAVGRGVERSIERGVEVTLGRSDFRISGLDGGTLSEEMLVTIRSVLGVEVAAPAVEQRATLLPEADTTAPSGSPVTILGIDPVLEGQIRDVELVAGAPLTRRDEAAAIITERLAAEEDYGLGSDVIVATPGEPERFRVIGIAAGDGPLAESGGRTVILPFDAVARMFELDGVARVDLLVGEDVPLDGVRAELDEALGGEPYVLTSPADLAGALRLPTTGFEVTAAGIAAVGTLAGGVLVFSAVRLTGREAGEVRSSGRLRRAAVRGATGSGVGAVLALVLAALTGADVAPVALGVGGTATAILVAVLFAIAAGALPVARVAATPGRMLVAIATRLSRFVEPAMPRQFRADAQLARSALDRDPAGTARTVTVEAIALGLVVAVATVGLNAHRTAAEQSPVLGRVVAQIDALGLLAVVVAGLAIVGVVALGNRERRPASGGARRVVILEAGFLGFAGAVLGSIAGLALGAVLIVFGGGGLDPAVDVPWAALGLSLVLGIGLSMAAAWYSARLARRLAVVRAVEFG
jgi:ABC-type antimicrobial peptide transport system permease subunit